MLKVPTVLSSTSQLFGYFKVGTDVAAQFVRILVFMSVTID